MAPCSAQALDGSPCTVPSEHHHCPSCAAVIIGASPICIHHGVAETSEWAVANRLYCDWLHRGKLPARLPEADRELTESWL